MSIRTLLTALAAATTLLFPLILAEERQKCGEASYFPSEQTCYNDKTLCPKQYSLPSRPCAGSGGCYLPQEYTCGDDGILRDLPDATGPFTLAVWGERFAYRNQTIKACGGYLAIGANARQCHACTAAGGTNCGSYKNATVFLPDGKMNAAVPGHQYWFVDPSTGLLQYTEALPRNASIGWNTTVPSQEFAGLNVKVKQNGLFIWDKEGSSYTNHWWFACLVTLPGGAVSTARSWRIYAPIISELNGCELVRIVATAVDKSYGVYKYS
ncbi:hypothetical protein QBC38DRAFT_414159 [Podospora fimiseda]|uniref:Endo-1,3(4)-beta-glucanase 1 carbohydrate binding domain-containing protein n=1 Tax=Podospora fimiseda TaxID=252190 RepID=A0AAN7H422_9PEZI|nr:hypothetical protein QBC38DRAFT_414159 [Podospora fimiseda]